MRSIIFCCLCSLPGVGHAAMLLDLRFTDGTTAKSVASGSTVFVDLILSETAPNTAIFDEGLISGGGRILQTAGAATVTSSGPIVPNAGFDAASIVTSAAGGGVIDGMRIFAPVVFPPMPVGATTSAVTLATFQLVATGAVGVTTATLSADVFDPTGVIVGNATLVTGNLDAVLGDVGTTPANFGSVILTVTAVPEPSTLLVGCLIVAGGLYRLRRRPAAACDS